MTLLQLPSYWWCERKRDDDQSTGGMMGLSYALGGMTGSRIAFIGSIFNVWI